MKDAGFALKIAYTTLLAGLVYEGRAVPVYSPMADNNAVAPYVIIDAWQAQGQNTKSTFGQSGQLNVQVITRYQGNVRSEKPASDIANLIAQQLTPDPQHQALSVPGFAVYLTVVRQSAVLVEPNATDVVIRKILTIDHSLDQL